MYGRTSDILGTIGEKTPQGASPRNLYLTGDFVSPYRHNVLSTTRGAQLAGQRNNAIAYMPKSGAIQISQKQINADLYASGVITIPPAGIWPSTIGGNK